jgi:hypothetical protein
MCTLYKVQLAFSARGITKALLCHRGDSDVSFLYIDHSLKYTPSMQNQKRKMLE